MIARRSHLTACVLLALYFTPLLCQMEVDEVPDTSGCDACKTRYVNWLTSKNINATYWQQHSDPTTAADELCMEADDIYNNCFMQCIIDAMGNTLPHSEDRNAQALEVFLRESCHNHACRLADTLTCSRGSGRNSCLPESRECYLSQLESRGCTPILPCLSAERQAFISTIKDSLDCFLGYPDLVAEGVAAEDDGRRGLQVCKDIILSGCLSDWSVDPSKQDFINFVSLDPEFQNQICTRDSAEITLGCIASAMNGTVSYAGTDYETPCDRLLMTEQAAQVLENSAREIFFTYDFVCSANASDLCVRKEALLETVRLDSNNTSPDTPPEDDMHMAEGEEQKVTEGEEQKTTEATDPDHEESHDVDPSSKLDEDEDSKHDEHDHEPGTIHEDHDEHDKEKENNHNHKHPGPVGKSKEDPGNAGVISRSWIGAHLLTLALIVCLL